MATLQQIVDSIAEHIRDDDNSELTEAQLVSFVNDAALDAGASGWVIEVEDDESITLSSSTFEYGVPATFSHVRDLRLRDGAGSWGTIIERHYWRMHLEGGVPTFLFERSYENKYTPGSLKVVGWKRPKSDYSDGSMGATVDAGLEPFLRDRAAAHSLRSMSAGMSELDRLRAEQSEIKMRDSQSYLENIPQQYRLLPQARYVPGR